MRTVTELLDTWLHRHPLILVVIPLMAGIACGDMLPPYGGMPVAVWWTILAVTLLVSTFVLYRNRKPGVVSRYPLLPTFFVALFSMGVLLIGHSRESVNVVWPDDEVPLALRLTESPAERGDMWRLKGRIVHGEFAGRDVLLQLGREGHRCPKPGDVVYATAVVRTPHAVKNPGAFDYACYLRRQGISGQAYVSASRWTHAPPEVSADIPIALRFARYRQDLSDRYARYLDENESRLVAAMTLGDKRGLDSEVRQVFSATGTSHVLALSGLHLGILFGIFSVLFLRGIGRRAWRIAFSLVGIGLLWAFTLLAGSPLSLVRAAIMCTILQITDIFYRERSSINNLSLAALLILLFSPASLFDVGFQLSFLSVFFILLLSPRIPTPTLVRRSPSVVRSLYSIFTISLIAQLGTLPLVAYYFHTVSVVGCVANLLVVPIVYVILVLALLFLLLPFGHTVTAGLLGFGVMLLDRTTMSLSSLPFSHFHVYPHWSEVLLCFLLFACMYGYFLTRNARCLWGAAFVCVLWFGVGEWKDSTRRPVPSLVIYDTCSRPMIHLIASADRSWILTTDTARASRSAAYLQQYYWSPCGLRSPRMVQADSASRRQLRYHGVNMVWVTGRLPKSVPQRPDTVTHLLLARGSTSSLAHLLSYYHPRHILIDGSLSDRWRKRYLREADSLHLSVYDIRCQGAWIEPLTE